MTPCVNFSSIEVTHKTYGAFESLFGVVFLPRLSIQYHKRALFRRLLSGPDCSSEFVIPIGAGVTITFFGSVLHLRGSADVITQQPLVDASGNVLLWNGEVFGGLHVSHLCLFLSQ